MRSFVAIALRVVTLCAASFVTGWLATLGDTSGGGAAIGAGLAAFAALIVGSLIWAAIDGTRSHEFARPLAVWAVVAVVVGIVLGVQAQGSAPRIDPRVLASDLAGLGPFGAGLVFVPALLALSVARLVGRRRGRPVDHRDPAQGGG